MRIAIAAATLALAVAPALADEIKYQAAGKELTGYYAAADDSKGLVLIVHDWNGVDDHERRHADMLAEMGYDAFALDIFGSGTKLETVDDRRAATGALNKDRELMRALASAGLAQARALSDADQVVVMGYCFGGAVALEMARSETAAQAVGYATFHGGLATPEGQHWSAEVPPLLIMHGGADSSVTMQDVATLVEELETAGITYTLEVYSGAPHGFTELGSDRYQERADRESWEAFSDFLARHLD
jgi:dienelactone hydrolase